MEIAADPTQPTLASSPIRLDYAWTFDDFVDGYRTLIDWPVLRSRLIFLGAACVFIAAGWRFAHGTGSPTAGLPMFAGAAVWIIFAVRSRAGRVRLFRQLWEQSPTLQEQTTLVIDDQQLAWSAPSGTATTSWDSYTHWRETDRSFVLFRGPKMPYPIPKRILSADQTEVLRRLLHAKLQPGKR